MHNVINQWWGMNNHCLSLQQIISRSAQSTQRWCSRKCGKNRPCSVQCRPDPATRMCCLLIAVTTPSLLPTSNWYNPPRGNSWEWLIDPPEWPHALSTKQTSSSGSPTHLLPFPLPHPLLKFSSHRKWRHRPLFPQAHGDILSPQTFPIFILIKSKSVTTAKCFI